MAEPRMAKKGPYVQDMEAGTYHWCACGHSATEPFCDGTHKEKCPDISPLEVKVDEAGPKPWCGCKRTKTPPYCDGTHTSL